jgi:cell division control protein 24
VSEASNGSSEHKRSNSVKSGSSLVKLKTRYGDDIFILAVSASGCPFDEILDKIERKIRICGAPMPEGRRIKLRYKDEDGDYITINTDEDVEMAFELAKKGSDKGTVVLQAE